MREIRDVVDRVGRCKYSKSCVCKAEEGIGDGKEKAVKTLGRSLELKAEEGIRDGQVTGVQTGALTICFCFWFLLFF